MAIANVALTDTFDYWRTVTNSLVVGMNDKLVYFGTANANSVSITPNASRQGNVFVNVMTTSALTDQSTSNIASIYSVNTVLNYAVTSFNFANGVSINATASFGRTNTVYDIANAAYNQANAFSIVVGNTKPVAVQGSVWWHNELGKLFVYYKDGDTDQWVDTSPAYDVTYIENIANSAFDTANAAFGSANNVAPQLAPAYNTANAAFTKANNSSGAVGGGADSVFFLNDITVLSDYSVPDNKNAMTGGPLSINSGVTVTINVGSTWTIV